MKTIHLFKIKEDSNKYDIVELVHDQVEDVFIVRWKWTSMGSVMSKTFSSFDDAKAKYIERKNFAKTCN